MNKITVWYSPARVRYGCYTLLKKSHLARKVVKKMLFIVNWHTLFKGLPTPVLEGFKMELIKPNPSLMSWFSFQQYGAISHLYCVPRMAENVTVKLNLNLMEQKHKKIENLLILYLIVWTQYMSGFISSFNNLRINWKLLTRSIFQAILLSYIPKAVYLPFCIILFCNVCLFFTNN